MRTFLRGYFIFWYDSFMTIHTIDLHFASQKRTIASYAVTGPHGVILVEPGPQSTVANCVAGLDVLGIQPSDVKHVFVTHIHLDHGGGAGWWAQQGAQVYVHPRGAKHLIDPSRLMASAHMVYGDLLESLFGLMIPIPASQVTVLEDEAIVDINGLAVQAIDTPGHARHHHAYAIEGVAFTGDAAASRMPGERYINLTSAPPQFDPHAYDATLTKLASYDFDALYLGHFGEVTEVADHLERTRDVMWSSAEFVHAQIRNGQPREVVLQKYVEFCEERAILDGVDAAALSDYATANGFDISGSGIHLYWEKRRAKRQ